MPKINKYILAIGGGGFTHKSDRSLDDCLFKIIDKKKLDAVNKPINKAHGLPNECYINKEYTLIERKKLFEDKWTIIGTASSLVNKGDVKPFDLLGLPLLIVRNKKNKIKVFHNVCSHRGLKLVSKAGNIKNVISL